MRPAPPAAPTAGNHHGWPWEWGSGEAFPENPMAGRGPRCPLPVQEILPSLLKLGVVHGASQQPQALPAAGLPATAGAGRRSHTRGDQPTGDAAHRSVCCQLSQSPGRAREDGAVRSPSRTFVRLPPAEANKRLRPPFLWLQTHGPTLAPTSAAPGPPGLGALCSSSTPRARGAGVAEAGAGWWDVIVSLWSPMCWWGLLCPAPSRSPDPHPASCCCVLGTPGQAEPLGVPVHPGDTWPRPP